MLFMRMRLPMRLGPLMALLGAMLTFFTMSQLSYAATIPVSSGDGAVASVSSAGISVSPGSIPETTDGNFSATLYGQGLVSNVYYTLTDNNNSCEDSINFLNTTILTDQNGRFEYTFFSETQPCKAGHYTIKASRRGQSYTTSFTLKSPTRQPESLLIEPGSVVSTTTGSFAASVYPQGLKANQKYKISTDFKGLCKTSLNSTTFKTDAAGNADLPWIGGPDHYKTSVCAPGLYTVTVKTASNNLVYTATLNLKNIHI
jgi:hypothetical protein